GHDADRGAEVAAEVERLVSEPFAAAIRGLEVLSVKTADLGLCARRRRKQGSAEQRRGAEQSLRSHRARTLTRPTRLRWSLDRDKNAQSVRRHDRPPSVELTTAKHMDNAPTSVGAAVVEGPVHDPRTSPRWVGFWGNVVRRHGDGRGAAQLQ